MVLIDAIQERLGIDNPETLIHEQALLREAVQKVCLAVLEGAGFFRVGAFHGGTALRILHGLHRFSEDLDFSLKHPRKDFSWEPYLNALVDEFSRQGLPLEVQPKKAVANVASVFIKAISLGQKLKLHHPLRPGQKLSIRLEVDINPPAGAKTEISFIDFPTRTPILTYDLGSSFSGKLHALLCRKYVKGRDWYDFSWYTERRVIPNLAHLKNAVRQQGPWAGQRLTFNGRWLVQALQDRIGAIEWTSARRELSSFLVKEELKGLERWWKKGYFAQKVAELGRFMSIERDTEST